MSRESRAPTKARSRAALAFATLLLTACAATPPASDPGAAAGPAARVEFPAAFYADPPASGTVYSIDAAASHVHVLVFRAGAMASQGHNHLIAAPVARGAVYVPARGVEGARADLVFDSEGLDVDPQAARATAGAAFEDAVPQRAREGTRRNLLGPAVLDAARFPQAGVQIAVAGGEPPHLVLQVTLTVKDRARTLQVPARIEFDGALLRVRGTLSVRQSELGLQPFSALGGLLRVADPVVIDFDLVARQRS